MEVDMSPWVGTIGAIIGWIFFIIVLGMLKGAISSGLSWAFAEILRKDCSTEKLEKMLRIFGNGDEILEHIKKIEENQCSKKS